MTQEGAGWSPYRPQYRSQHEEPHRSTSFLRWDQVRYSPATNGYWGRGRTAREESKDVEHGHVRTKSTAEGEGGIDDITDVIHDEAAMHLGERGGQNRAEGEADQVDTDGEGYNRLVSNLELGSELSSARRKHCRNQKTKNKKQVVS